MSRHSDSREGRGSRDRGGDRSRDGGASDGKKMYLTFDYTWTISVDSMSRFTSMKTGECMKSPKFVTRTNGQTYVWQIELYPNGFHRDHAGWMSLFLVLVGGSKPTVRGNYVVDVVDRNLEKRNSEESNETEFTLEEGVGHSRYLRLDIRDLRQQGLLQNQHNLVFDYMLNLHADAFKSQDGGRRESTGGEVRKKNDTMVLDPGRAERFKEIERPRVSERHGGGYDRDRGDDMNYDIRIIAGDGGRFYCHSSEMSHASDILKEICDQAANGSMAESDGVLEIEMEGVPTASVREVLRHVYCGEAQLAPPSGKPPANQQHQLDIGGICNVAEQWNLQGLLKDCQDFLMNNLRPDTAVDAFLCAVDYGMPQLKHRAAAEILSHMQAAVKCDNWPRLVERPKLVTSLFMAGPIHEAAYVGLKKSAMPANRPGSHDQKRRDSKPNSRPDSASGRRNDRRDPPKDPSHEKENRNDGKVRRGRIIYSRQGR